MEGGAVDANSLVPVSIVVAVNTAAARLKLSPSVDTLEAVVVAGHCTGSKTAGAVAERGAFSSCAVGEHVLACNA